MGIENEPINSVPQQAYFPDFSLISNKNYSDRCCTNHPKYEVIYNYIPKTWFVCNECLTIEAFNSDIVSKVRISK